MPYDIYPFDSTCDDILHPNEVVMIASQLYKLTKEVGKLSQKVTNNTTYIKKVDARSTYIDTVIG